ncbi:uncharacterized protein LOC114303779, partial [Camellia sinensis]|uniref:uncharacterized protein LOC114303779 n=1 Tax=Camellia sinensis TaxID=4442 RepID=UPI001036090A
MDVKSAFLNGDLQEEVYMQPLPRYPHSSNQALGFSSSSYDFALFIRKSQHGIVLLLLYVDDMIFTSDDVHKISALKKSLSEQFEMKDLAKVGLTDSKTVSTPLKPNEHLTPLDDTPLPTTTLCRQLVGSLVYFTVARPNIAHAVHFISQFLSAHRSTHYVDVLRIICYVKDTLFYGLYYPSSFALVLRAYSDADWADEPTDCRSTTGFCFFLGDSLICWHSKKQTLVSCSSIESEYHAFADTAQELLWLCWLLYGCYFFHCHSSIL